LSETGERILVLEQGKSATPETALTFYSIIGMTAQNPEHIEVLDTSNVSNT